MNVSTRFMISLWFFFTIVIIATYQGNLFAFVVAEKSNLLVKGLEDIPKQSVYKVGTVQSTHHMFLFKVSIIHILNTLLEFRPINIFP